MMTKQNKSLTENQAAYVENIRNWQSGGEYRPLAINPRELKSLIKSGILFQKPCHGGKCQWTGQHTHYYTAK